MTQQFIIDSFGDEFNRAKTQDPIVKYNYFVSNFNNEQNLTHSSRKYRKMKQSNLFNYVNQFINDKYLNILLIVILILAPLITFITFFTLLYCLILIEYNYRKVYLENTVLESNPFKKMIFSQSICKYLSLDIFYFDIDSEEI